MENNNINAASIERQTLIVGAAINLIMAFAGWLAYYLSNSQALLLDGNYSFIMFLALLVAMKIAAVKTTRTKTFPFGLFVYEALYSLVKGVMIAGVLLVALINNSVIIIHYINGSETQLLNTTVILVYSIFMVILCFGMAWYFRRQNSRLNNSSTIIHAEYSAAIVDGFMSAGIGTALVGINFIHPGGNFGFLNYIGDAILVVVLCVLLGKEPVVLVRNSFIELAGGTLQDKSDKKQIEDVLIKYLSSNDVLIDSYISKTGSSYIIVAYLNAEKLKESDLDKIMRSKQQIIDELKQIHHNITFEMVLEEE